MMNLKELLSNDTVEKSAKALFESQSHPMLAAAGYATNWDGQPTTVKLDYRRKARTVINSAINCNYPDCNCPFDHPGTKDWCAKGLISNE